MSSIPLGGSKAYAKAVQAREDLLQITEALLRTLVFEPDTKVNSTTLDALEDFVSSWEAYTKAITSSNRGYEFKDLKLEEREMYERCKHFLRVLRAVHGPQVFDAS